ncbi:beta-1,3-glucan-binding protein isoform X2 [Folsomia candida]|uniref:beta-1,3-glucan-binding protein isoform X2 n=1 Tax=Folsomia candida TaxID=158441 RepID=UPI0016050C71|nr:beta-1,3-glucan-binding protein isoform X2 [Folsomia candida]
MGQFIMRSSLHTTLIMVLSFGLLSCAAFFEDRKEWSVTESTYGRAKPKALIFREEFNTLDLDLWDHEITMSGGGNGEFQVYQNNRSNSYVKYGKLYIKPTLTADKFGEDFLYEGNLQLGGPAPADQCTNPLWEGCERRGTQKSILNPIMSARLRTVHSFAFKYGKVEIRAKIPTGDWLWPGIWLLPLKNQYGSWPASGEIDILEARGNTDLKDKDKVHIGTEQVSQTLHYGPFHPINGWQKTHFSTNSDKDSKAYDIDFHVYELHWTPDFIKFSIDGDPTAEVHPTEGGFWEIGGFPDNIDNPWKYAENPKMAPFDQKFYILLNVAVGGTNSYFPDSAKGPYTKPWKNNSPTPMLDFWKGKKNWWATWKGEDAALVVDYIRVYAI